MAAAVGGPEWEGGGRASEADIARLPRALRRVVQEARRAVSDAERVVCLTGAGVSAESGVPTFRDPGDGLWSRFRPEELATPEAFRRDPCRVWEWYDLRRRAVLECEPNAGHLALARFLVRTPGAVLVTQNVDGLHQRAVEMAVRDAEVPPGPVLDRILPLHGDLLRVRCSACSFQRPDRDPVDTSSRDALPTCPRCGEPLRPAVVWFGEMLDPTILDRAFQAAGAASLCIVAGTSAVVHPAAAVPVATLSAGGALIEVNPEETPMTPRARWRLAGGAAQLLPLLLDQRPASDYHG